MAAAIARVQVGVQVVAVVITAAKAQDGSLTLRIEDLAGATDLPMSQSAMVALGNTLIQIANS